MLINHVKISKTHFKTATEENCCLVEDIFNDYSNAFMLEEVVNELPTGRKLTVNPIATTRQNGFILLQWR